MDQRRRPFRLVGPRTGGVGLSFINGKGGFLDLLYASNLKMATGQADYYYPNAQSTRLVWYHDHAHGITRLNAYAGIATGYLLLDTVQESALGQIPNFPTIRTRCHSLSRTRCSSIPTRSEQRTRPGPRSHRLSRIPKEACGTSMSTIRRYSGC